MSSQISLQLWIDTSQADESFQKILTRMPGIVTRFLNKASAVIEFELKNAAPEATGALRSSITTNVGADYAEVTTGEPYAVFVDQGSRAHIIEGHPWLVFNKDGRSVFARKVNHPGYKGAHFTETAISIAGPQIDALIDAEFTDLVK